MCEIEDDGFITVHGLSKPAEAPIGERCADCFRHIQTDGSGHLNWCPYNGYEDFPRLYARHPATSIGE